MKSRYFAIIALALGASTAFADGNIAIKSFNLNKSDERVTVDMTLDASRLELAGNRERVFTPMIVTDTDTLRMPSFSIAGRNRWYSHLRNEAVLPPTLYRSGEITQPINYSYSTPMQEWMKTSHFVIETEDCGCCGKDLGKRYTPIADMDYVPKEFVPEMAYISPKAEAIKMRSISARAYIDFPVNRIEIFPDYRRNPSELKKIQATIDSVRKDQNLSITGINIHGYASPEGSYANNARLAKGRTEALATYVNSLFHFPKGTFTTEQTPEDWAGLKAYVESDAAKTALENRDGVLAIIDDAAYAKNPDLRNETIKKRFPKDYAYLLENIYPGLRHSDYDVKFNVRDFTDPKEIIETMKTAPQNLSLQELFVAANSVEKGSPTYNEAFEIAARMFPNDPVANLNAGFCALQRDELGAAEIYLRKAGDSDEAKYARAVLLGKQGKYHEAEEMMQGLSGLSQARQGAADLEVIIKKLETPVTQVATEFE